MQNKSRRRKMESRGSIGTSLRRERKGDPLLVWCRNAVHAALYLGFVVPGQGTLLLYLGSH
ncbi:hypothetical protein BX600DRAFT_456202, partial [Xylariales sp. PMI_506]